MEACGTVDLGVLVGTQLAHEPHFTVRLYQAGREWQVYRAPPPPHTHTQELVLAQSRKMGDAPPEMEMGAYASDY